MPSKKDKVLSYLSDDESQALKEFCRDNEYSQSQGVAHLVRNYLIENDEVSDNAGVQVDHEKRIIYLEAGLKLSSQLGNIAEGRQGELLKQIAELRHSIRELEKEVKQNPTQCFTDEEIASVTGRRVQEVYEWRMGIRKPRGRKILEKLKPYKVIDGQWKKSGT